MNCFSTTLPSMYLKLAPKKIQLCGIYGVGWRTFCTVQQSAIHLVSHLCFTSSMPTRIYLCSTAALKFSDFVKHSLIVVFSVIGASTGGNFSIVVSHFTLHAPVHETHPFLPGSSCISGGMLDTSWHNSHKLSDWCAITITSTFFVKETLFGGRLWPYFEEAV